MLVGHVLAMSEEDANVAFVVLGTGLIHGQVTKDAVHFCNQA
jgi:hypothetical protein